MTTVAQPSPLMTDADIAALVGVNIKTLQRRIAKPVAGELDLNRAEPQKIGGRRFWVRTKVERVLGIN